MPRLPVLITHDEVWKSTLRVIDFHPGVGYQVNEKLSVGLGIGLLHGYVELGNPFLSNGMAGAMVLDGSGWGFNVNVGAMYDINEDLHTGISYKSQVLIIKLKGGEVKQDLYTPNGPMSVKPGAEGRFSSSRANLVLVLPRTLWKTS